MTQPVLKHHAIVSERQMHPFYVYGNKSFLFQLSRAVISNVSGD